MKPYPMWKGLVLALTVALGALYALPNLYGDDPSVQISRADGEPVRAELVDRIERSLSAEGIEAKRIAIEDGAWVVRLDDEETQLASADTLRRDLDREHVVALNLAPQTPQWLADLGGQPMALGLDLRGGVHFLLEVDVADIINAARQRTLSDVPSHLREKNIRYTGRRIDGDTVVLDFPDAERLEQARPAIRAEFPELEIEAFEQAQPPRIELRVSEAEQKRVLDFAVKKNLTTLRNRVNQLGVAEPVVQRQGAARIVVRPPGVQDTTRVKELLGATATLEYRAVIDQGAEAEAAAASGVAPFGTEIYFYTREGNRPVLVKAEAIATGNNLIDASAGIDSETGGPMVNVTLDGAGAKRMFAFTEKNLNKPMAVLYRETKYRTTYNAKGEPLREKYKVEEIISVANIKGVFGKRFRTTGLETKEAQDLAILLRAGALAAPIDIVEERTVGPSLGKDNIAKGQLAALAGFLIVVVFMLVYYKVFGLIANLALGLNVVLIIAGMSLLQATLTLPGIAGVVLTMGMAVDANVLIFERIREELAKGQSPSQAIEAGYDRAFLTIADANITTLIAAVMLFALGSGPVKGFAVTLSIGIVTSMFTAIVGTRAVVQLFFGGRRLGDLPV